MFELIHPCYLRSNLVLFSTFLLFHFKIPSICSIHSDLQFYFCVHSMSILGNGVLSTDRSLCFGWCCLDGLGFMVRWLGSLGLFRATKAKMACSVSSSIIYLTLLGVSHPMYCNRDASDLFSIAAGFINTELEFNKSINC